MQISFLHTAGPLEHLFEQTVRKTDQRVRTVHHTNEQLLKYAREYGTTDADGFLQEIETIRADGSDLIICTCSTYGTLSDQTPGVVRIDRPIAEYLVENYPKIGLAYTTASTLEISILLFEDIGIERTKSFEMEPINCSSAWQWVESGNLKKYHLSIADTIKRVSPLPEVIFLAQASMAGAANHLTELGCEIVSSPEFGIRTYIARIHSASTS